MNPSSKIQRFLEWLTADTVFLRSCMFITGSVIFFIFAWAVLREWPIQEFWIWFIVVPLCAFGLALMLIPLIFPDKKFERYLDLMADGDDIPVVLFFVVVMLSAIPLTAIVRLVKNARKPRKRNP